MIKLSFIGIDCVSFHLQTQTERGLRLSASAVSGPASRLYLYLGQRCLAGRLVAASTRTRCVCYVLDELLFA